MPCTVGQTRWRGPVVGGRDGIGAMGRQHAHHDLVTVAGGRVERGPSAVLPGIDLGAGDEQQCDDIRGSRLMRMSAMSGFR